MSNEQPMNRFHHICGVTTHVRMNKQVSASPYCYVTLLSPASTDENVHSPAASISYFLNRTDVQEMAAFYASLAAEMGGMS